MLQDKDAAVGNGDTEEIEGLREGNFQTNADANGWNWI
jgi:hypothetical protein